MHSSITQYKPMATSVKQLIDQINNIEQVVLRSRGGEKCLSFIFRTRYHLGACSSQLQFSPSLVVVLLKQSILIISIANMREKIAKNILFGKDNKELNQARNLFRLTRKSDSKTSGFKEPLTGRKEFLTIS